MQTDTFRKLLPFSGIIAALLFAASFFYASSGPQIADDNHAKVIAYYVDNSAKIGIINIICGLLACFFLAPLLTELRATLRSGEAGESIYSTLFLIGGTILVAMTALMAMFTTVTANAADVGVPGEGVLTLAAIVDYTWMPWVVGMAITQWAVGLGGLRTASLPKPLAWFSVVLGVLCLAGPGGILAFFLFPIWLIATSIVLMRRPSGARAPVASPAAAAA
ncbi:MAG: hypothetical protein QM648_04195 [Solirubrobacterales bacterium]